MEIHSRTSPLRTHERALTDAARAPTPAEAARLYLEASHAAFLAGEPELARRAAVRAREHSRDEDPALAAEIAFVLGWAELRVRPSAGRRTIRQAIERLARSSPPAMVGARAGFLLAWLEEYGRAVAVLESAIDAGRRGGDPGLAIALDTCALVDFRCGRWHRADARSAEALRLALAEGQGAQAASAHTTLARIAAARGEEHSALAHLEAASDLAPEGSLPASYAATATGLLELGLDRPEPAAAAYARLAGSELAAEPSLFEWEADWIEALVRSDRGDEAAEVLERLEIRASTTRRRSARALATRCRGLLAPSSRFPEDFERALDEHGTLPTPFDRARTALCYGERLRRARRRADARAHLQAALGTFETLGAVCWAGRARRELGATRRRAEASASAALDGLTPHELQVATLVGRGARNREIAAALFVSERTVEYHLTNIYAKLDIRSRTELARLLLSA